MGDSGLIPLKQLKRLYAIDGDEARRWAVRDSATLAPSDQGLCISRADLRKCLTRRQLPIPTPLEEWPRVLVADDDLDMLKILFWLIEQTYPDAVVLTAQDGQEALEKLLDFKPHLFVTDLQMPKFDGVALCRRIRNVRELGGTKILAVSGHNNRQNREAFFESGATEFIAKPFDPHELKMSFARLLGERPVFEDADAGLGLKP